MLAYKKRVKRGAISNARYKLPAAIPRIPTPQKKNGNNVPKSREFVPSGLVRKQRTPEKIAEAEPFGLNYPATQVGVVGNITVSYDPALGAKGLALATQMLTVV